MHHDTGNISLHHLENMSIWQVLSENITSLWKGPVIIYGVEIYLLREHNVRGISKLGPAWGQNRILMHLCVFS